MLTFVIITGVFIGTIMDRVADIIGTGSDSLAGCSKYIVFPSASFLWLVLYI